MKRQDKVALADDLRQRFAEAKAVIFTNYTGLTVAELAELRKHLGKNLKYRVVKNTIAEKAAKGTPVAPATGYFKGQLAVALSYDDPVGAVKRVTEFAARNKKLKLGVGIVEGRLCLTEDLKEIAVLPPRQVLLGILAGTFKAPLGKMACGLSATIGRLNIALNALEKRKLQ